MAKEKNYNPVQDHKKQEKQKQIKKQKANLLAQRNEKLARRNPNRIQRDIDSLKEAEEGGALRPHERQRLAELEKDLAAVNKAREALGDKAPQSSRNGDTTTAATGEEEAAMEVAEEACWASEHETGRGKKTTAATQTPTYEISRCHATRHRQYRDDTVAKHMPKTRPMRQN
jgi:hypothetical protein